jgi:hypothetical protein
MDSIAQFAYLGAYDGISLRSPFSLEMLGGEI